MMQITAQTSGTLSVGDPWPAYVGTCQTGCPHCTCCTGCNCAFGFDKRQMIVITPAERGALFVPPQLKASTGRPFHQKMNRKPWERR